MRAVFSWILFVLLTLVGLLLAFAFLMSTTSPGWQGWLALTCIALSAVLLLPPLWRGRPYANIRLAIAIVLALAGLFSPFQTHAIKLDMPRPHRAP